MTPTGIEALVCEDIAARQQVGIRKYGTTLEDADLSLLQTVRHAYEEATDLACYLRKVIQDLEKQNQPNEV